MEIPKLSNKNNFQFKKSRNSVQEKNCKNKAI